MIEKTGIPDAALIESVAPSPERRAKGPVAVTECFMSIPCNPCYTACPFGAMKALTDINELPAVDHAVCTGCGVCVSRCPGLAIFIVDDSYSETEGVVRLPYEFLPLPAEGDYVTATDRAGRPVCRAKVLRVQNGKAQDRTPVVWLVVPKELTMTVRCLKLEDYYADSTVVCRCEELTLGQLREYIRQGYRTLDELKRVTRAGMGPCQGRTCRQLILQELQNATGAPAGSFELPTFRPPVKPIRMELLLHGEEDEV